MRNIKIMIIYPPWKEDTYCTMPLGIGYIAAVLRMNGFEDLRVVDSPALKYGFEDVRREVRKFQPDIVAITAKTPLIRKAARVAEIVKAESGATVVLGGIHPSSMPDQCAQIPGIDVVVRGEGEYGMLDLAKAVRDNVPKEEWKKIAGITYRYGGKTISTLPRPPIADLDTLPFPAWDLFPVGKKGAYKQHVGEMEDFMTMVTSRGCPWQCIYCENSMDALFGRTYRYRSAENTVREVETILDRYGSKEIVFYDDLFTVNQPRVRKFCNLIIKKGLKFNWKIESRVDLVTPDLLALMKKAGCSEIAYGVETGSEVILKEIHKQSSLPQAVKAFKMTKEAGIDSLAYMMIGFPSETRKTINMTIQFAKSLNPDYVEWAIATPYPKTLLHELAKKEGLIEEGDWEKYCFTGDRAQPVMRTIELSPIELKSELARCVRSFYLRPNFILKHLLKSYKWSVLKRNISGLRQVLKWSYAGRTDLHNEYMGKDD